MRTFISSTQIDLANHRNAVADAVERLGLQTNRMEKFGAKPNDAIGACLSEIEDSELFVGIYAHRYGYIPPTSKISITEAEFNHAHKNRRPTFCFVVDEAYSWPIEFIDQEPKQALLQIFKKRIGDHVVRDYFTTPDVLSTRVATSISRYLLADPRKHGAADTALFARITLTDAATMTFVDVMRLACIAGGDVARTVNGSRYNEFVDIADYHFSDFRVQLTRSTSDCDFDMITKSAAVERGLGMAIVKLRREPKLATPWEELIIDLYTLAERINLLAETVSNDYYEEKVKGIHSLLTLMPKFPSTALFHSPDDYIRSRHTIQQAVLNNMRDNNKFSVNTIRDDVDRQLAVRYFIIDLFLLRSSMKK